jgi:serine/threonine-protein kinase RsbT
VSADEVKVAIERELDIVAARQAGRNLAAQLGFTTTEQTLIATAISEVARNIVVYAQRGEVALRRVVDVGGRAGIEVVASDRGPGIADVALAMRDGYSTKNSLGLGLPGAKRLMDELAIASELGLGTTVTMKKWLRT